MKTLFLSTFTETGPISIRIAQKKINRPISVTQREEEILLLLLRHLGDGKPCCPSCTRSSLELHHEPSTFSERIH